MGGDKTTLTKPSRQHMMGRDSVQGHRLSYTHAQQGKSDFKNKMESVGGEMEAKREKKQMGISEIKKATCVTEGRFNCKLSTAEAVISKSECHLKKSLRMQHRDRERRSGFSREQNQWEMLIFLPEKRFLSRNWSQ